MDPDLYILSWQIILGGSSAKFWQLIKRFGSAKEAWQVSEKALLAEKLFEPDQLAEINKRRLAFSFEYWQRLMEQKEITYLDYQSKEYPDSLKNIYNSPPGLFMRGNPELLHRPMLAMVGARRPTNYGLSVARKFGREIAEAGVIVVSGLAKGIDAAAHEAALSGGGSTLAGV
ncbi:MAG: DNA-protecting protein DprA, partial [Clostridia bacterium]|nr:DNA-protecting protein DprA [Clostridia bacterium]